MNKKNILITGGAGFIGSHLCGRLAGEGHHILCLDNFFTGRLQNLEGISCRDNIEVIRHDITEKILLEVDEIYHLACPASPVHYQYNAIKTIKTNVLGSLNVLGLAKRIKAKVLLASTSEVYGDPKEHPQKETYWGNVNPIGIRSCYDEGKRVAETLFMDYHRSHRVDIRIVRIFNTYGPHMCPDDGRVVSNFIMQTLRGEPLTIYGDGNQTRSFCYVDDLVSGLIKMMGNEKTTGPVNLGNPDEFTIRELADLVRKKINPDIAIRSMPLPHDDPRVRKPDISLAKKTLGWEPRIPLTEGLDLTIKYFRDSCNN